MEKKPKEATHCIGERFAVAVTGIALIVITLFIMACAESSSVVPIPTSVWRENYIYHYEPPDSRPPGSVRVTLAIVTPDQTNKALDSIYGKVVGGLGTSIAADMDKIIIAKGMTVTGPFESLDMMTYPDKKNADLSLTPEFFLNAEQRELSPLRNKQFGKTVEQEVEIRLDGWMILVLREPLSSEKIWIKKIPLGEATERAVVIYEAMPVYKRSGDIIPNGYRAGQVIFDGRKDALANMLKQMYPTIMNTAWTYLNTQEIAVLRDKAKEIRQRKVF